MRCVVRVLLTSLLLGGSTLAQQSSPDQSSSGQASSGQASPPAPAQSQSPQKQPPPNPPQNEAPPRSEPDSSAGPGESSSRDTQIDTSPPKDDRKDHPNSNSPTKDLESDGDVQEMHPWNPYRAVKDDEVGDFYLKQKSYKAALARYQDALVYKPNDALANFRMAQCYEKLDQPQEAIPHYQEYLKILPQGPYSKEARKALAKLGAPEKAMSQKTASQ